jgi:hypothetical protein
MAVKKTTVAKKAPAKKAARKTITRKYSKGDTLVCEVCGLEVVVDTASGLEAESAIICCEKPMKLRKAKTTKARMKTKTTAS